MSLSYAYLPIDSHETEAFLKLREAIMVTVKSTVASGITTKAVTYKT